MEQPSLKELMCELEKFRIKETKSSSFEVVLSDFGSSCFQHDTQLQCYIASRDYRAPELLLGAPNELQMSSLTTKQNVVLFDAKIDMWSLGCVLFEMNTGIVLFGGENIHEVLARILSVLCSTTSTSTCNHDISNNTNDDINTNNTNTNTNNINTNTNNINQQHWSNRLPMVMKHRRDYDRFFTPSGLLYKQFENNDNNKDYIVYKPKTTSLPHRLGDTFLSKNAIDFIANLLEIDPCKRMSSSVALEHHWLLIDIMNNSNTLYNL